MRIVELSEETFVEGILYCEGQYCAVGAVLSQLYDVEDTHLENEHSHQEVYFQGDKYPITAREDALFEDIYELNDAEDTNLNEKVELFNEVCVDHKVDIRFELVSNEDC